LCRALLLGSGSKTDTTDEEQGRKGKGRAGGGNTKAWGEGSADGGEEGSSDEGNGDEQGPGAAVQALTARKGKKDKGNEGLEMEVGFFCAYFSISVCTYVHARSPTCSM